jgi:hypothetical protein
MPDLFQRIPTDVEAMQLCTPRDLHVADLWLRAHGVESAHRHPAIASRGLLVPAGPGGIFTIARLGQWLTRDLTTGEFTVPDDDLFQLVHRASDLTAVADALR